MELCIKTVAQAEQGQTSFRVSILVLMELCIKTISVHLRPDSDLCFNPCFNGTMYKNTRSYANDTRCRRCFNPCFNGTMYKNLPDVRNRLLSIACFNPCFNGTMYKNGTS